MPAPRIPMRTITEVLRLKYDAGLSHEKIARACGLSRAWSASTSAWPRWPASAGRCPTAPTRRRWRRGCSRPSRRRCASRHRTTSRSTRHSSARASTCSCCGRSTSRSTATRPTATVDSAIITAPGGNRQRRSMRQVHRAGEKLFIDYCGPTVPIINQATGEVRQAQVFVAVLGASSYTYAEATWSQALPDWIASHQRAFQFLGGVPELLVPDNLKSAVTRACRYESQLNTTYAEMARHYQVAVLPARPYKPKDKAKAEAAVLLVERWIPARLRHHTFFTLASLNQAIRELLEDLNCRPFQGQRGEPARPVPGHRPAGFAPAAGDALRVRRVAQGQARHRLPPRPRQATVQRPSQPGRPGAGSTADPRHGGGVPQGGTE